MNSARSTPTTSQQIEQNTHQDHFCARSDISDRDDICLMRVNVNVMSNLMFASAQGGVVNVATYNSLIFEGVGAQIRQAFKDRFTSVEVHLGRKITDDSGLFLYAGIADQDVADQGDSPYVFGKSFATSGAMPKDLTLRTDAFNILDWFNETLNKRAYYLRDSDYSMAVVAVPFQARHNF